MHFRLSPGAVLISALLCFVHTIFAQTTSSEFKRGHQGSIRTYALSPSNKFLVTAASDHQLILWDYASGKQIREIQEEGDLISLAISPDDHYLFSADTACQVKKWDLKTGKLLFQFTAHGASILPGYEDALVEIAGDYVEEDKYLKEEYRKTKVIRDPYLEPNIVLSISSDGRHLITGGRDAKIKIWDANTGKLINTFFTEGQRKIETLLLSKDLKYLVSMDRAYQVMIRQYPSGKLITKFIADRPITQLSKDQQHLLYLAEGDSLKKIQLSTGRALLSKKLPHRLSGLISIVDETQIIGSSWPDSIFYIDGLKGEVLKKRVDFIEGRDFALDLRGQLLSINYNEKKLSVIDLAKETKTERFGVFVPDVQKIEFSENGQRLLINNAEANLDLLNLSLPDKPQFTNIPLVDPWFQHYSQFSPDAKQLAIAAGEGDLWLWDLEKLSFQHAKAHYKAKDSWDTSSPIITDLSFSPDGRKIILADYIYGLCFFDVTQPSNNFYYSPKLSHYHLIQTRKDSALLLINHLQNGPGNFMQVDLRNLSKQGVENMQVKNLLGVRNINESLVDFDFSKTFDLLIYRTKEGEAGVMTSKTSQKLVSYEQCTLAKWIGPNKRYAFFQSQRKVVIWDSVERKIVAEYNLPFLPMHTELHPSGHYFVAVRPDQGLEFWSTLNGAILFRLYWKAGTKDFYLQNKQGQADPQSWQKLDALLKSGGTTGFGLSSPTLKGAPEEVEAVILNIGHQANITKLNIQGRYLFTVDDHKKCKIWDLSAGRELRTLDETSIAEKPLVPSSASSNTMTFMGTIDQKWVLDPQTGQIESSPNAWKETGVTLTKRYSDFNYPQLGPTTGKFILPDQTVFEKNLPRNFEIRHITHNADKDILSFIGYLGYGNDAIVSFYGATYQDSLMVSMKAAKKDRSLQQYWVLPGTDSLIARNYDGKMSVFNPLVKTPVLRPFLDDTPLAQLIFSNDGQLFARSILKKGVVEIWDLDKRRLLAKRNFGENTNLIHLAFNESHTQLVVSNSRNIWNWDWAKDTVHQFINFQLDVSERVAIFPSGTVIFNPSSSGFDYKIQVLDLHTGDHKYIEVPNTWREQEFYLYDKLIINDRTQSDKYLDVLHPDNTYSFGNPSPLTKMVGTTRGSFFGLLYEKPNEFIWWDQLKSRAVFQKKTPDGFYQLALNLSETLLALSSKTQVLIIDAKTGQEKLQIPLVTSDPKDILLQFSGDARFIFIQDNEKISIWSLEGNKKVNEFKLKHYSYKIIGASHDGQTLYVQSYEAIYGFNQQGKELFSSNFGQVGFTSLYFPVEDKIIAVTLSGILYKINANTGAIENTLFLGKKGKWIIQDQQHKIQSSASAASEVHVRNKNGQIAPLPKQLMIQSSTNIDAIPAMLPGKKQVIEASKANPISPDYNALVNTVWQTQLKSIPKAISDQSRQVNNLNLEGSLVQVHITPDEKRIIFQLESGRLVFVEKASQRLLKTLEIPHMQNIKSVMSKNGQYLICLSKSQGVQVYNPTSGNLVTQKKLGNTVITALNISNNGQLVLLGTLEGKILGLNLPDLSIKFEVWPADHKIYYLASNDTGKQWAAVDDRENLWVYDVSDLSRPVFSKNEESALHIHQLSFGPQQNLIIGAERQIYSLPYANTSIPLKLTMKGRANRFIVDPVNPARVYLYDPLSSNFSYHYDVLKGVKIDSFEGVSSLYCISPSGQSAIINTSLGDKYQHILDLQSRQKTKIASAEAGINEIELLGNDLYYRNRSLFYAYVYKISLLNSHTQRIPGVYNSGRLLFEKNKVSHFGPIGENTYGFGKQVLGDTTISWIALKQSCEDAVSENGQYVALNCEASDTFKIYSSAIYKLIQKIPLKSDLEPIAISNDGKWLAARSSWHGVEVYDLTTHQPIYMDKESFGPVLFSRDISRMVLRREDKFLVYDLKIRKIIQEIPLNERTAYPSLLFGKGRYGIVNYGNAPYQLWNLEQNTPLGNFYFFNLADHVAAWIFISVDGKYDGSPAGLQQMYSVDEQTLSSRDLDLKNDPKYQPGLLSKLLK